MSLALQLCSLADSAGWDENHRQQAATFAAEVRAAARQTEAELLGVIGQRRRARAPTLPLHKEMGASAKRAARIGLTGEYEDFTSWSTSFAADEPEGRAAATAEQVRAARDFSALAEKGDENVTRMSGAAPPLTR